MFNCEVKLLRTLWLAPAGSMVESCPSVLRWGLASLGLRLQGAAPRTDGGLGKATKAPGELSEKLLIGNHSSKPVLKLPNWGVGQIPPV